MIGPICLRSEGGRCRFRLHQWVRTGPLHSRLPTPHHLQLSGQVFTHRPRLLARSWPGRGRIPLHPRDERVDGNPAM